MNRTIRVLRNIYEVTYDAVVGYFRDDGPTLSAAVAYYMFLAIIPIIVTAVSVSTTVFGSAQDAYEWVMIYVDKFSPDLSGAYRAQIRILVDEVINIRGTAIGVGIVALVWIALNGICALEHSINSAWKLTLNRNLLMQRVVSLVLLFLLFAMLYAASLFSAVSIRSIQTYFNYPELLRILTIIGSYLVYFLAFLLIYWTLVRIRVAARAVVVASLAGAVIWGISKAVFSWFLVTFAQYSRIYGSVAGIMVFLIWMYFSVVIIVFCAEIGYAVNLRSSH
ncbi:MAG: YihY/virulence factor BrkB family protein, partial [Abditibacteriota bacterium]|nr:YihY/virulence factor BrkB family protein [Abditibacteriota bacterium]